MPLCGQRSDAALAEVGLKETSHFSVLGGTEAHAQVIFS